MSVSFSPRAIASSSEYLKARLKETLGLFLTWVMNSSNFSSLLVNPSLSSIRNSRGLSKATFEINPSNLSPIQRTKISTFMHFKCFHFLRKEAAQPNKARRKGELHYYTGDCTNPETRSQIKEQFIKILNSTVQINRVCREKAFRDKCKAENVKVTCSLVDIKANRNKREAGVVLSHFLQAYLRTLPCPLRSQSAIFCPINARKKLVDCRIGYNSSRRHHHNHT